MRTSLFPTLALLAACGRLVHSEVPYEVVHSDGPSQLTNVGASPEDTSLASENPCETAVRTEILVQGDVELPMQGRFFLESHLATQEDSFKDKGLFPTEAKEGIDEHLTRSCDALLALWPTVDCALIYATKYARQWTPPENGLRGQGAVGNKKPSVIEEAFTFNMGWKARSKPAPGTRYLLTRGERAVVAIAGYEMGPNDVRLLGGVQAEVAYFLDADNESVLQVEYLVDQTLPPGPIRCAR